MKNQEIPMFNSQQQSTFSEYDEIESRLCDLVVSDAEKKLSELQTTDKHISFVFESVEHYIMMNDVVHCLLEINCSITNLKCELLLHCISFLEKMFDDISFAQVSMVPTKYKCLNFYLHIKCFLLELCSVH